MKVAITADLQFATQFKLSHETSQGISSRLLDQVKCFHWMVDTAVERECEAFLSLGDIYDARNVLPVSVVDQVGRCYAYAAEQIEHNHILVGNHDSLLRSPAVNSLQTLRGLADVWDEPGVWGPFAFVPWIEDPDEYRSAVGLVAQGTAVWETKADYMFSHVMIEGAVPADIGRAKRDLRPQQWKRIFLGDIHEPLSFDPNIQYAGAPMQHHFGDVGGERGFGSSTPTPMRSSSSRTSCHPASTFSQRQTWDMWERRTSCVCVLTTLSWPRRSCAKSGRCARGWRTRLCACPAKSNPVST